MLVSGFEKRSLWVGEMRVCLYGGFGEGIAVLLSVVVGAKVKTLLM